MSRRPKDPARAFLRKVIAADPSVRLTLRAVEKLDQLDEAPPELDKWARMAEVFGVTSRASANVDSTLDIARLRALEQVSAKLDAGTASAAEINVAIHVASMLGRRDLKPVDKHAVRIEMAKVLSGAELGPEGIPQHLRVNDSVDPEPTPAGEPADLDEVPDHE